MLTRKKQIREDIVLLDKWKGNKTNNIYKMLYNVLCIGPLLDLLLLLRYGKLMFTIGTIKFQKRPPLMST